MAGYVVRSTTKLFGFGMCQGIHQFRVQQVSLYHQSSWTKNCNELASKTSNLSQLQTVQGDLSGCASSGKDHNNLGQRNTTSMLCQSREQYKLQRQPVTCNFNGTAHYLRRHFQTSSSALGSESKALTVWQNVRELHRSPLPALTLGLSGLIPFIAAPVVMITSQAFMPSVAFAQLAYGASILSFLGGVRWGFTLPEESPSQPDWLNLGYSVMPSLVAWTGLMMPHPWSLLTVMTGLGLVVYSDMVMWGYPAWFKGLRFLLSFVAILALWTTCMCAMMLPQNKVATSNDNKEKVPNDSVGEELEVKTK